jgi:hypothetical protein
MRRVHAGFAGLGLVFMITALGALALPVSAPAPSPSEPLAELGVAPSPPANVRNPAPGSAAPAGATGDAAGENPISDRAPQAGSPDIVSI